MRGEAQSQSQGQRNYRREGGQAHTANARGGTKPIHLIIFNPRGSAYTEGKEGRHTQPMRGEAHSQSQGQRIYRREGGQAHTANARGGTKPLGSAYTEGKEGRHTQPMRGEAQSPWAAHIQKGRRAGTHSQCAGRHQAQGKCAARLNLTTAVQQGQAADATKIFHQQHQRQPGHKQVTEPKKHRSEDKGYGARC